MKTPQEWLQEVPLNDRSIKWVAAIQADARTGMVPVEKVKELVEALQMWTDIGLESLAQRELNRIRATNKALATAREMGVL